MREKLATQKFTDYSYFKDVARFQKNLTRKEEEELFQEYTNLSKAFKLELLLNKEARVTLLNTVNNIKENNKSIAKLHYKFDNKKSGHNQNITKEMNVKLEGIDTNSNSTALDLYNIGFSKETYDNVYNTILPSLPEEQKEKLLRLKESIKEIETKLTCSALKMAVGIAQKYTANIFNIDIKDAIQEATIGVYESVDLYNPEYRTSSGSKIKFATYANIKAEKRVKEKIMETSRLIKLPKSRLNVLFTVLRAGNNLENPSVELITQKSNELLERRKKRKLKQSEILSEERIEEAILLLNNNCIMLDTPIQGDRNTPGDIKTFSDIIPDPQLTAEDNIIIKDSDTELRNFIQESLDYISENIILARYLKDPPLSHEETASYLYEWGVTKKQLGKEAVRQKETAALNRLMAKDTKGKLKSLLLESISMNNRLEDQ